MIIVGSIETKEETAEIQAIARVVLTIAKLKSLHQGVIK